jgi:ABC-type glutathione transport system ATPase component
VKEEPQPFLRIERLTVERSVGFGEREVCLRKIDLELARGEIHVLAGEAGSGKSLLCRLVAGVLPPHARILAGSLFLDGVDLLSLPNRKRREYRRRRIGFVGRGVEDAFDPEQTVDQALRDFCRRLDRGAVSGERWSECFYAAGIVEPESLLPVPVGELDFLAVQQLAVTRALLSGADLLICDEADAFLDPVGRSRFIELLCHLRDERGITLLMASGRLRGLDRFADRVSVYYEGAILESGDAGELLANPAFLYTREFLASSPKLTDRPRELAAIGRDAIREAEAAIRGQPESLDEESESATG